MNNDIKLNYDDVTIVPEEITNICSRKDCNPYDKDGFLPIFASCMSSVVSKENIGDFNNANIRAVLPRNYSLNERIDFLKSKQNYYNFVAFSLEEAKRCFVDDIFKLKCKNKKRPYNICIDLANGHMACLLEVCKEIKKKWGNQICIMSGNVANPKTYKEYEEAGIDYVRCGIGGGSCCTTNSNVSVGVPYFSLIKEIYEIKKEINGKCKIIADGNIRGYRDIQKALIYADYVMIGGLFNKAIESAGKTTYGNTYWNIRGKRILRPITTLFTYGKEIKRDKFQWAYQNFKDGKLSLWKEMYGMSTKIAQAIVAEANNKELKKLKTSEGLFKYQKVEYNLKGWSENETDYLRSAMSYTNSRTLDEYKNSQWVRITNIRYNN